MRRFRFAAAFFATLLLTASGFAATTVTPTTTYTAETSNNTSAAHTFTSQSNGNLGASNISKVDTRSMLYAGSTTKIFAHYMPWFGNASHMNVGYSSDDPNEVDAQVSDMQSRGISGTIIDWYGPGHTWEDTSAKLVKSAAEMTNGAFQFSIMEDQGALQGCGDCTGQLVSDLTYAYNTYEGSTAYYRVSGRPVVFFFDVDNYPINWSTVESQVPGNPIFIFRNAGGFTHQDAGGSYSWIIIDTSNANDWNQSYLTGFYSAGQAAPSEQTFGTGYKGFNDNLAAWTAHRVMNQNCGSTWLSTFSEIASFYSASKQLESLQLVTWNDYEEGSEIETGIDNCVSISASVSGQTLNWTITGSEGTVDHYTPYISIDGQNLMKLADVPAGTHSANLGSYGFASGTYTVYVKAVGKPSMLNHMSQAVTYVGSGGPGDTPPVAALSVTPLTGSVPLVVTASTAASKDPDGSPIVSSTINFGDGTVVSGTTASHTYTKAGTYTVTATVADNAGLTGTATTVVTANGVTPPPPPPTGTGVTISSPANNATVGSPANVIASAAPSSSSHPISAMMIYVDSKAVYTTYAATLNTNVTMSTGSHNVVVQAWDTTGAVYKTAINIMVGSAPPPPPPPPPPSQGSVTISSPSNGASVSSPATFVASAAPASSAHPITAMAVYVDNNLMYTVNAAGVNKSLTLASGAHYVVIQAWDTAGAVYKSAINITVASAPPPPPPPSTTGVTISSPSNGTTVGSPATFVASAAPASSAHPITAMAIYVDNNLVFKNSAASLSTPVSMSGGSHYVVVQAWDSAGVVYKTPINITVN